MESELESEFGLHLGFASELALVFVFVFVSEVGFLKLDLNV